MVVEKLGHGVELRKYNEFSIAEVTFKRPPTMQTATKAGFRKCAGYIFGKNRRRGGGRGAAAEKMAMTSPVRMEYVQQEQRQQQSEGGTEEPTPEEVKISFVMASNYSLGSLPVPQDSDVKLRTVPAHFVAAVAFRGRPPSEATIERKRSVVLEALAKRQQRKEAEQAAKLSKPRTTASIQPQQERKALVYGYHDPFITPRLLRRNEVGVRVAPSTLTT